MEPNFSLIAACLMALSWATAVDALFFDHDDRISNNWELFRHHSAGGFGEIIESAISSCHRGVEGGLDDLPAGEEPCLDGPDDLFPCSGGEARRCFEECRRARCTTCAASASTLRWARVRGEGRILLDFCYLLS